MKESKKIVLYCSYYIILPWKIYEFNQTNWIRLCVDIMYSELWGFICSFIGLYVHFFYVACIHISLGNYGTFLCVKNVAIRNRLTKVLLICLWGGYFLRNFMELRCFVGLSPLEWGDLLDDRKIFYFSSRLVGNLSTYLIEWGL